MLLIFPERREHAMPRWTTGKTPDFGPEAEAETGRKPRPKPLISVFSGKTQQGKQLWFGCSLIVAGKKSVLKDVENRAPLFTADGNINCCRHYGKQYGDASKN